MGYKYFKSSLYKKTIRQYLCGIVVREVVVLILPLALYVSYIRIAIHQSELLGFISLILLIFTIYFFLSNATRIQKYVLSTYFQLNQDYQETTKIGNHKILASHIENNFNYINDNSFTELHLAIKPLYFFILIYVIVTAIFSNFLAIVPIIIISIHWLILRLIHKKYNLCTQRCSLYLNRRYLFFLFNQKLIILFFLIHLIILS